MSDPEALVSIYQAANVTEAHLVKNLMLDAGIAAVVSEENEPLAGLSIAAPDVLVHQRDFTRAEQIIEQYEERQVARMEGPQWKCDACGAMNYAGYDSCDTCGVEKPGEVP
ncbi:MAG TPA: DUF2007 domain-containing protein [Pirellulales bacterium]